MLKKQLALLCTALSCVVVMHIVGAQASPGAPTETNPPLIDAVEFKGNTKISSAKLSQSLPLKAGEIVSREKVKAALDSIVSSYRSAGFNLSVSPDISHPAAGHVVVTFAIDESGTAGDSGPAPGAPPPR